MVWILTKYILLAAVRDRLVLGFLFLIFLAVSLSLFLGSSAITESDIFSLVFMASGLRVGANISLLLFIVFYIRRSFDSRDVDYLLSRPISRLQFLTSHFIAFSILAFLASILIVTILFFMPSVQGVSDLLPLWWFSLWIELNIMAFIGVFFAMVLSSAVAASLSAFSFYVLARLIGDILGVIASSDAHGIYAVMEKIMLVISVFIPRLDLMAQTSWLVYADKEGAVDWLFLLTQGFIFSGVVFCASFVDLKKRQF